MKEHLTLIDDRRIEEVPARFDEARVRIPPADLQRALGWHLQPEGLCRGSVCVPVRNEPDLSNPDGIDLAVLARVLGRPLALDVDARVAFIGASARERGTQLASLQAPEFTLPDLSGRLHSLSDYRGNKVLLIAYASW